jgi:predicted O-methyltransferase YrrM
MKSNDQIGSVADHDDKPSWTPGRMAFQLDECTEAYVLRCSSGYGQAAQGLFRDTLALGEPAVMMLAKEQYAFLRFLAHGCRLALDLGTFTGLSALALAEAMPEGRVITIDRSRQWTSIAERHWRDAGVRDRIDARCAEVDDVLAELAAGQTKIDLAFVDVDKAGMSRYAEAVLDLLGPDGVLVVDNTLWHGWVFDADRNDANTEGVRRFNRFIECDPRLEACMLPIADGVTLVRRRRT